MRCNHLTVFLVPPPFPLYKNVCKWRLEMFRCINYIYKQKLREKVKLWFCPHSLSLLQKCSKWRVEMFQLKHCNLKTVTVELWTPTKWPWNGLTFNHACTRRHCDRNLRYTIILRFYEFGKLKVTFYVDGCLSPCQCLMFS